MSTLTRYYKHHCRQFAYIAAAGVLVSLCLPWLQVSNHTHFSALQSAQLFLGAFAWGLFALFVAALFTLLLPITKMPRFTALLGALALPAWLSAAVILLFDVQNSSITLGFVLAGLSSTLLSAGALFSLVQSKSVSAKVATPAATYLSVLPQPSNRLV